MAFIVPDWQVVFIRDFLELPDDKLQGFLSALDRIGPQFNADDLSNRLSAELDLPSHLTYGITRVLISAYLTREMRPTEVFVDKEVRQSLRRADFFSGDKEHAEAQWRKLREFLIAALSHETTIGATAKAGPILTEHERIFTGARVMTDLRPIYRVNVSEKPDAAVIVHMLKISQRDAHDVNQDFFFALDSRDLSKLKEHLERAMMKEEALKNIMKSSGVKILDPKAFY